MPTVLTADSIVLRLPSRLSAKKMQDWRLHPLPFACTDHANKIIESGVASLTTLAERLTTVKKTKLIMAASDVMLLNLAVPPLSPEKMKLALPALVEDSILGDPVASHIVIGTEIQGLRQLAVIDRAWMMTVINALREAGARICHAYPAQLCLPVVENSVIASVFEFADSAEISIRWSNHVALGISLSIEKNSPQREENICQALRLLTTDENCQLMVESDKIQAYSAAAYKLAVSVDRAHQDEVHELHVIPDDWKIAIAQIKQVHLDLTIGIAHTLHQTTILKIWRLPLALAATLLLMHITALHSDWWRMRHERQQLITSLDHVYKKYFTLAATPEQQLKKLQEKFLILNQQRGGNTPEDFLSLLANTAITWQSIIRTDKNIVSRLRVASKANFAALAITKLEYRDHVLQITLKPNLISNDDIVKTAFSENHLILQRRVQTTPSQTSIEIWHIQAEK